MFYDALRRFAGVAVNTARSVANFAKSFIPSKILQVIYINPADEVKATEIYNGLNYFSWPNAHVKTRYLQNTGFYVFRVWNSHSGHIESYFVSASNLSKAFSMKSLFAFWALTDDGIIQILSDYVRVSACNLSIFAIMRGTYDITSNRYLQVFIKSLSIPNNITAEALLCLCDYIEPSSLEDEAAAEPSAGTEESTDYSSTEQASKPASHNFMTQAVTIVDFELEETVVCGSDFIIKA